MTILTYSNPPVHLFVKLREIDTVIMRNFPLGVVPLERYSNHQAKQVIKFSYHRRSAAIIEQFPVVGAFAITTEKCQGLTFDSIFVAPLLPEERLNPQKNSLYVIFSRVKNFVNMRFLEKLTLRHLDYYKPKAEMLAETNRLNEIGRKSK